MDIIEEKAAESDSGSQKAENNTEYIVEKDAGKSQEEPSKKHGKIVPAKKDKAQPVQINYETNDDKWILGLINRVLKK